jgi:hypothetical protein
MNSLPFLEGMINGKKVAELLSSDPWVDTNAAYELLEISRHFYYLSPVARDQGFYQLVEMVLKKRYWACRTGIAPESQQDKDIEDISVLDALMFFRRLGQEAKSITDAIDTVWQSMAAKGELDTRANEGVWMLLEQAKEGNELAKVAVDLLRESYHARAAS